MTEDSPSKKTKLINDGMKAHNSLTDSFIFKPTTLFFINILFCFRFLYFCWEPRKPQKIGRNQRCISTTLHDKKSSGSKHQNGSVEVSMWRSHQGQFCSKPFKYSI